MPADRNSKRKAKRDPDASEDDDDFEIKPKVKRSESDDESEEDVKPKKKAKQVKRSESDVESEEDVKPSKKAKSKREPTEDEDEEEEAEATPPPAPKSKPPRTPAGQTGDELVDEDGRPYFLVSDKKRVTLSEFKGKQYVNIREYYTDKADGKDKPGKKGITLDLDQWKTFKTKISTVDGWIASSGSGKAKKGKK